LRRQVGVMQIRKAKRMKSSVNVKEWVAMFKEIGLSHEQMGQWHRLFEARHPEGHEGFLQWLGLPAPEIARIRSESR